MRPRVLAQRIPRSPNPRPLLVGRDPTGRMRALAAARPLLRRPAMRSTDDRVAGVLEALERQRGRAPPRRSLCSCGPTTPDRSLRGGRRQRGPGRPGGPGNARGTPGDPGLRAAGLEAAGGGAPTGSRRRRGPLEHLLLPRGRGGEAPGVVERAARDLAGCARSGAIRSWRSAAARSATRPAPGGPPGCGACRSPRPHPPSSARSTPRSGARPPSTLPEGKNLVGAFHQPAAVVVDVRYLRTLPVAQPPGTLGEAAKMAAIGDERLFELLEAEVRPSRPATAGRSRAARSPRSSSAVAGRRSRCRRRRARAGARNHSTSATRCARDRGRAGNEGMLHARRRLRPAGGLQDRATVEVTPSRPGTRSRVSSTAGPRPGAAPLPARRGPRRDRRPTRSTPPAAALGPPDGVGPWWSQRPFRTRRRASAARGVLAGAGTAAPA